MPLRKTVLATGEIYHVFNRGVNHQPIFIDKRDYPRGLDVLSFYRFAKPSLRFSFYNRLTIDDKVKFWKELEKNNQKIVTLFCFCFMPNHFHFLLRQEKENGVSKFLANFQNSYTKYINTRHARTGHLLQGQFKAVRIETDSQFLHTSRYIHLNPYTSYLVKSTDELKMYPWSSLPQYIDNNEKGICSIEYILSNFPSKEKYLQFVLDQKDYQRRLKEIEHLLLE
jgi:putative transposase